MQGPQQDTPAKDAVIAGPPHAHGKLKAGHVRIKQVPTCWRTIAAAPGAGQATDDADNQHRHAPITLFRAPMMAIRQTRTGVHSGGNARLSSAEV